MKTMFLSLVCLCIATCLSAQSVSDSLHLEIASIVPGKYNNYDVNISIENQTKDFCYVLFYSKLKFCDDNRPCWEVRFEVEYKDGVKYTFPAAGAFFMGDLQKAVRLMPGERRADVMPLFFDGMMHGNVYAIFGYEDYTLSDIKRIRVLNGRGIIREPNVEDLGKHFDKICTYDECTIASDWYDVDFTK